MGNTEPHNQALNFLELRGDLSPERRRKVRATTFKRLLGTPYVRERLGIDLVDGTLRARGDKEAVAKALLHVARDIADGSIKVHDVYNVDQREKYADELPESVVVSLTRELGAGVPLGEDGGTSVSKQGNRQKQVSQKRERLIPTDCTLNVTDLRLQEIERELRHLDLEKYPNAISVLMRVFLELSADWYADWYIENSKLQLPAQAKLGSKLTKVTDDLVCRKKLTKKQFTAARRAAQKGTFLGPSITQMHEWIHNQHMFPSPADLRSEWNGLQPWFVAVWPTDE